MVERYRPEGPHEDFEPVKGHDQIHLMRNLPFEFFVRSWAQLPPAAECAKDLAYAEVLDVVNSTRYLLVFQRRASRDTQANKSVQWYIYNVEREPIVKSG